MLYIHIYCLTVAQSFHSLVCQSHWHKKQMTSKCNPQLRHLLRSIPVTQTFYSQALPLKKDRWIKDRGRGVLMNEAWHCFPGVIWSKKKMKKGAEWISRGFQARAPLLCELLQILIRTLIMRLRDSLKLSCCMNKRDSCGLLTLGLPFRHHHFAQLPAEALEPALHFLKGLLLYPVCPLYFRNQFAHLSES